MAKKLSLLLATVGTLSCAVPAVAGGSTGLTQGGALLATGKTIILTDVGNITITSTKTGNINCGSGNAVGGLTVNNASEVTASSSSGGTSICIAAGAPVGGFSFVPTEFTTTGGGSGTVALSFALALSSGVECKYSTPGSTFTYNPMETSEGGNLLTISEQILTVTPPACGKTAKLDWVVSLTKGEGGGKVFLM